MKKLRTTRSNPLRQAGRPHKREHHTAVQNALELFWDRGFEGAAVSDLVQSTGLLPGSLYGTFKNKENLFIATLRLYGERAVAEAQRSLRSAPAPAGIKNFFATIINRQKLESQRRGCFLVKTVIENAVAKNRLHKMACHYLNLIENEIYLYLKSSGSFDDAKFKEIAKSIICNVWGLRVLQASGAPNAVVQSVSRQMLNSTLSQFITVGQSDGN